MTNLCEKLKVENHRNENFVQLIKRIEMYKEFEC